MNYLERFQQYADNIKRHTEAIFPIESRRKRLEVSNVRIEDASAERAHNWSDFQKAKENDRSFMGRIVGDVKLLDKATGNVLEHKKGYTLNMFPHVTALGSYVVNGKDLQVVNQLRRRPGAYPVITADNNTVTKVTAAGLNHEAILDRETGQLLLKVKSSHLKLVPLLQELGVPRADLEKHLGAELVQNNQPKTGARSELLRFYQLNRRIAPPAEAAEQRDSIIKYLASKRVDPDVTQDTLGHRHDHVSPLLYLHSAKAAVDVAKGHRQPADMESLVYKSVHSIEDFVDDSLKEAYPQMKRRLAYMMDRKKDLKSFLNVNQLSRPIINKFVTSEFTRFSDQSNPMEILGTMHTVTSMGEGGIQSEHAITDALRNVHNSHFGFLDPVHTPEGPGIGVIGHLAMGVRKVGNKLVREVFDTHENKLVTASPVEIARGGIAFADQYKKNRAGKMEPIAAKITAITPDGKIDQVHHSKIRYVLPNATDAFSLITNAIPFLHANSANRMLMADRHMEQSVPLTEREAPLVQAELHGTGYDQLMGTIAGKAADGPGRVKSVRDDHLQVVYDKDPKTVHKIFYSDAYPLNAGTVLKMTPAVKQGQRLKKGMTLLDTNFTKDGALALGRPLVTALMPWRGYSFEDGIVISEAAAHKLASEHLTEHKAEKEPGVHVGFDKLYAAYPAEREKSTTHRMPKVGDVVKPGQLLIPVLREVGINPDTDYAKVHKALRQPYMNASVYWDGGTDGVVKKVIQNAGVVKVYVESKEPLVVGDKLSSRAGSKGIVTHIIPMDQMPRTKDGQPIDVLFNPYGVPGRVNPTFLFENAASKIARKTGKPYLFPAFDTTNSVAERLQKDLKQHGLSDTETVVDPTHNEEHKNVMVGENYWLKLRHQVKKKWAARSHEGPYTVDERPVRGGHESAQGIGPLDLYALLSNGYTNFLHDVSGIKSTKNTDYWAAFQLGVPTPPPKRPFILDKFETYLQGAGINVQRQGDTLKASPFTDKDIKQRSNGAITAPQVFRVGKSGLLPERGGLFDPETTGGHGGTHWNHIELAERVLNPLYEQPVKAITGMAMKDLEAILEGRKLVDNRTGGEAIAHILGKIDVKQELKDTSAALKDAPASKRDGMLRKLRYLAALDKLGMSPVEAYTNKTIPVIPAKYRPVYDLPDGSLNVSDVNHGYREVLMINRELEKLKQQGVSHEHLAGLREGLYKAYSGLVGLTEPVTRSGHFKGFISQIAGNQNKHGLYQAKVVMRRQDLSGRSAIINGPHLGMDEVGIPERMARDLYKPYLVRSLVNLAGLKPADARKEVETGSARVNSLLDSEMKQRPVLLNRAPALHKFSEVALIPHRVPGDAIHLNPLVFGGLNADVDGDACFNYTFLAVPPYLTKHESLAEWVLHHQVEGPMAARIRESVAYLDKNDTLVVCDLEDFPRSEIVGRKDHRTFFSVPPGIRAIAIDEKTGTMVAAPVQYWSRHENIQVEIVTLTSGKQIISDDDERAVYGVDSSSLQWCRRRPTEAKNQLVPVLSNLPVDRSVVMAVNWRDQTEGRKLDLSTKLELTSKAGYFVGAHIGDGWATSSRPNGTPNQVHLASIYPEVTEAWVAAAATLFVDGERPHMHSVDVYGGKLGSNPDGATTRHTISHTGLASKMRVLVGHGAANKHLPPFFFRAPDEFLLGMLAGLWDTDGTAYWSNSKKKPQFAFTYQSNSLRLVREIKIVMLLLGVETHIVATKTPKGEPTWVLQTSLPSLHKAGLDLPLKHQAKLRAFREFMDGPAPATKNSYSQKRLVPLPQALSEELAKFFSNGSRGQKMASEYVVLRRDGKRGHMTKETARKVIEVVGDRCNHPLYPRWRELVEAEHYHFEAVTKVEVTDIPETGYDLTVPGHETFLSLDGVVLSNTVGVHIPHSELAREELLKNLPSRNIMSPKSGDVQHSVGKEATLGLYMMTTPHRNQETVSVKSPGEAVEKYQQKKIQLNTPLHVAGRDGTWTVGHFLLNAELPEQYKLKKPMAVGGKQYKSLINSLVASHPDQAGRVISRMKDLGFDAVTRLGFSVNLKSLTENNAERDRVAKEVEQIMKTDPEGAVRHAEKRLEEILDKHVTEENPFALMSYKSGASNKHRINVRQLILAPGGVTDLKGRIVPIPLMRSYADGLTLPQYWATMPGARKGIADRAVSTQDTGAFNKELVNTTIGVRVTDKDCGTKHGISLPADHPDLPGRWIASGAHAGQLITSDLAVQLRKEGKPVMVRSPMTCALVEGVCQHCAGLNEASRPHPIGFHIGAYAGTTITEPITQMVLRAFHSQGAVGAGEVGYKRIRQIFTMPQNIRGKATLAKDTGQVSEVITTDRGGWDVVVNGIKHFVPNELGLAVKVGDHVKQGDQLSNHGVLKIQEVAELRGHEAARDQLIKDLDSEMSAAGQNIRRRIYEVAMRPLINRVEVLDPGDAARQGVVAGDVLNVNYVKQLNEKLKTPIEFKPIVMSIKDVPFVGEDFVGPLMYQRLPRTLREAPAVGGVTHLKGEKAHPIVEYAWGNLGDQKK